MALPDADLYHKACHMTRVLVWCRNGSLKQCVQVEQVLAGIPLESVPWCLTDLPCKFKTTHNGRDAEDMSKGVQRLLYRAIDAHPYSRQPSYQPWTSRFKIPGTEIGGAITGTSFHCQWMMDDQAANL